MRKYENGVVVAREDHRKVAQILRNRGLDYIDNFGARVEASKAHGGGWIAFEPEDLINEFEVDGFKIRLFRKESMSLFIGGGTPRISDPEMKTMADYMKLQDEQS